MNILPAFQMEKIAGDTQNYKSFIASLGSALSAQIFDLENFRIGLLLKHKAFFSPVNLLKLLRNWTKSTVKFRMAYYREKVIFYVYQLCVSVFRAASKVFVIRNFIVELKRIVWVKKLST